MAVDTALPSVFDAGLPTLDYDPSESPNEVYPRIQTAQRQAPIAIGPLGPEVLSYELARAVLRDTRFGIPPGLHLMAMGVTSGPLWDKVTGSLLCLEGAEHQRLRSLVSKAFTPRATARLHDTIDEVVNDLIDGCGRRRALRRRHRHRPALPGSDHLCAAGCATRGLATVLGLGEDIFKAFSFNPDLADEEAGVMRAWGELDDYVDEMIARRRTT